jgi:dihydroorotate dehydrogenase
MYSLIRRLLFLLDAEDAHDFVARQVTSLPPIALRLIEQLCAAPAAARRQLLGLNFRTPVGIAAGFDKNAEMMPFLAALGFGFIEVGTVTLHPQPGNPRPRMFRVPDAKALVNRMGFNNDGARAVAERLARWPRTAPLFVNVGKNRDVPLDRAATAYAACSKIVEPYADAIVLNLSSPNTPSLRELQRPEHLVSIIDAVGATKPLLVKIAPDVDDSLLAEIVDVCLKKTSGMICTNTTVDALAQCHEAGGVSGAPLRAKATRVLARVRELAGPNFALIGVGGIFTADDAREKFAAGADLVQLYTGFIYEGPGLPSRLARELA